MPPEFVCPITQERMADPVVASDGHSYERSAIVHVIFHSSGLSPLTRERLRPELFPNVALRKRICEHEGEMADALQRLADLLGGKPHAEAQGEHPLPSHTPPLPPPRRAAGDAEMEAAEEDAAVAAVHASRAVEHGASASSSSSSLPPPAVLAAAAARPGSSASAASEGDAEIQSRREVRAALARLKLSRYLAPMLEHGTTIRARSSR